MGGGRRPQRTVLQPIVKNVYCKDTCGAAVADALSSAKGSWWESSEGEDRSSKWAQAHVVTSCEAHLLHERSVPMLSAEATTNKVGGESTPMISLQRADTLGSLPKGVPKAAQQTAAKATTQKPLPWQPVEQEVVAAVESLYVDELKPFGRILRKRLVERAATAGLGAVDIDIKRLQATCVDSESLLVQDEEGGEFSAVLIGRPDSFVDFYSPLDVYPAGLWPEVSSYFESLQGVDAELPGGRYGCALALVKRGLPFFAGYSLGRLCHIVQLAISQKKVIGYLNGTIVPYGRSQSMAKECCAGWQFPFTGLTNGNPSDIPIATWETAKACLRQIMDSARSEGKEHLPISNVKRLFRSQFQFNLSETALGYTKLSGLLQDTRFSAICTVQLREQGYVVVPQAKPSWTHIISLADELASPVGAVSNGEASRLVFCPNNPLDFENVSLCMPEPVPDMVSSNYPSVSPSTAFFEDGYICSKVEHVLALSPCAAFFQDGCSHMPSQNALLSPASTTSFEDIRSEGEASTITQTSGPWPLLCPSVNSEGGSFRNIVKNTFIHVQVPLPTALLGSCRRTQSVPRTMGSSKNAWDITLRAVIFQ